jgi:hypothetical protein
VSLLSDPGLPRRRRTGPETSRLSYGLSGEGVLVRVRTYGFPGCFTRPPGTSTRHHPHEPTASKPVVPGDVLCPSSVAVGQQSSRVLLASGPRPRAGGGRKEKDAVPGRLRNPFRPASTVFLGGAASHLFGLALRGSVPRRVERSRCRSGKQLAGEPLPARSGESLPGRADRAVTPVPCFCARGAVQGRPTH